MSEEDREYLAFLASWVTDRIVTTLMNHACTQAAPYQSVCSYEDLKHQTNVLLNQFNDRNEDTE